MKALSLQDAIILVLLMVINMHGGMELARLHALLLSKPIPKLTKDIAIIIAKKENICIGTELVCLHATSL